MEWIIGIGIVSFIGVWIWIGWELYKAPLLTDDDMKDAYKDMNLFVMVHPKLDILKKNLSINGIQNISIVIIQFSRLLKLFLIKFGINLTY